jgi:hypothetical protein
VCALQPSVSPKIWERHFATGKDVTIGKTFSGVNNEDRSGQAFFCLFSGRPRHIGLKDLSKSKCGLFQLALRSNRVFKNKHQAVSQGVRRFGKRSIFIDM